MKALLFSIMVILLAAACNNSEVVDAIDPIDPTGPTDPMDNPIDSNLIEIKSKWEGDYFGTLNYASYSPSRPPIYDTLYNQKIEIRNFTRDSIFTNYLNITMVYNDTYIDSVYYGLETELLSDSALLIRFDEAFSHSNSKIKLDYPDSTLITDYSSFPYPGGGSVSHGFYKRR